MTKLLAFLLAAFLLGVAGFAVANIKHPPNEYVHVGVNDEKEAEVAKKVKITKKKGQSKTSAVSLAPEDLGPVRAGQLVRGMGEVEVSVTCTEPSPQCVGKLYKYSPKVQAQYVLAKSARSAKGEAVGRPVTKTCSQKLPNRNHHCVLVLDRAERVKKTCERCFLNIVLTAWHKKAKKGNVLVIGADSDSGIKQGQASISAAVFKRDPAPATRVYSSSQVLSKSAVVVDSKDNTKQTVLASVRVDGLRKGDALLVTAKARTGIKHLGYNVLTQGEILVSQKKPSTSNKGVPVAAVSKNGTVAKQSGFNCTRGPSAYSDPCPIFKAGAAYMEYSAVTKPMNDKGASVPLYFNLLGSFGEQFGKEQKSGDKVKVKSARIKVERISAE